MPPPNLETKQQPNPDTGHNNHKKNLSTLMSTPISTTATSMPPHRSQLRHLPCHHIGLHANLNYATRHASTLISNTRVRIEATLPQNERERCWRWRDNGRQCDGGNKLVKDLYKSATVALASYI